MDIFELAAKLTLDSSEYEKGVEGAGGKLKSLAGGVGTAAKTLGKIGVAAAGAVTTAVGGLVAATGKTAEAGDNIDKMSQKIGISAQAYQEWDFILQHSGASVDGLQMGMKTLSSQLVKAKDVIDKTATADAELEKKLESGQISLEEYKKQYDELYDAGYNQIDAFNKLGLSMMEIEKMSEDSDYALQTIVERLQQMPEGAERTQLATELLGRSATEMGALFNTTAEETEEMRKQVHELGGVMSDEAVKSAAAYQDSLQNMKTAFSGVGKGLTSEFLPSLVDVMDGVASIVSGNDSGISKLSKGLQGFTQSIAKAIPKISKTATRIIPVIIQTITENLPSIMESGSQILMSLAQGILDNLPMIVSSGMDIIMQLITQIISMLPQIIETGMQILVQLALGIAEALPQLIPTIVQVVAQITQTLIDNIGLLLDAAIQLIMGLAEGLIAALPILIEQAPILIQSLVDALVENLPILIDAAIMLIEMLVQALLENLEPLLTASMEIIFALMDGLITAIPDLLTAVPTLITSLLEAILNAAPALVTGGIEFVKKIIEGISSYTRTALGAASEFVTKWKNTIINAATRLLDAGREMVDKVKSGIMEKINNAKTWGKDLIDNFVAGIKEKAQAVVDAVKDVGSSIKSFLGFSEPELGPLSNFHTYAPDMMQLFAEGIEDNEDAVVGKVKSLAESISDAARFDLNGTASVNASMSATSSRGAGISYAGATININISDTKTGNPRRLAERIAEELSMLTSDNNSRLGAWA